MALKLPPKPIAVKPAVQAPAPITEDEKKVVSVQLRIDQPHKRMLDVCAEKRDSDRADTLRYFIRLMFTAFGAKDAKLIVTDSNGKETSLQVIKDGVPI
jgi:hypothetical protein